MVTAVAAIVKPYPFAGLCAGGSVATFYAALQLAAPTYSWAFSPNGQHMERASPR